jgi:nicotinamidase-related amidase
LSTKSTNTALLVVDVQTDLVEGPTPLYQYDSMLANINTLLAKARTTDTPVIYIQDNDVDEIGSPGWQVHPAVAPREGELVIRKPESDAFYATSLQKELDARGITHLVVVGCKTDHCVDATCRKATDLGYNVTLVADAHSTTDNSILTASQTIAYHNHILERVWSDEHGEVVGVVVQNTDEVSFE